ncbi:MAG: glycosyltransferase [Bacteroidota bacterium]|nr:glycosyltransferase [Bacteroidota bacterium]
MKVSPLVSVLMPVYNGEKYLRCAIESILAQTFTDFEFIIINDGSTDTSEEIISSYNDPRIRYFRNDSNLKLIATLNKGLDLCNGKYIARMDADDFSFPERFENQVKFMESNPEYGLCGADIEIEGKTKSWIAIGDNDFIRFCFLFHNPFNHPVSIIRTSVIRNHKLYYPDDYVHAEEYIFWLDILSFSKGTNLDKKLLKYRLHDGQVSSKFRNDQREMGQRIRLELFKQIVPYSTAGMRKAHLVIAEMTSQVLEKSSFEQIQFNFGGWVTVFQLRAWLFAIKTSLIFNKKWDSIYLRKWINAVDAGLKIKMQTEGSAFKN